MLAWPGANFSDCQRALTANVGLSPPWSQSGVP